MLFLRVSGIFNSYILENHKIPVEARNFLIKKIKLFSAKALALSDRYQRSKTQILYYIPGFFLLMMGIALLFSPSFFIGLLSALLIYAGILSIFLSRRLIGFVAKYKALIRQIEARIYIKGHGEPQWGEQQAADEITTPDKKTVFH